MIRTLAVGGIIASMLGTPTFFDWPTPEDPSVPDEKVVVKLVTVNGSGCPDGTADVAVSPDNMAFTVTYSAYTAEVGVGTRPTNFRRNCQLSVAVQVPSGFTYAIAKVDYRGYASLAEGATALQRANYYFMGTSPTAYVNHYFTGEYDDNWQVTDTADLISIAYAPCGEMRNLNINTELRVKAGTSDPSSSYSLITMDSTDTDISTVYHFSWMKCPTP